MSIYEEVRSVICSDISSKEKVKVIQDKIDNFPDNEEFPDTSNSEESDESKESEESDLDENRPKMKRRKLTISSRLTFAQGMRKWDSKLYWNEQMRGTYPFESDITKHRLLSERFSLLEFGGTVQSVISYFCRVERERLKLKYPVPATAFVKGPFLVDTAQKIWAFDQIKQI